MCLEGRKDDRDCINGRRRSRGSVGKAMPCVRYPNMTFWRMEGFTVDLRQANAESRRGKLRLFRLGWRSDLPWL